MTNRTVKVTIEAGVAGAIANIKATGAALRDFGGQVDKMSVRSKEKFNDLTTGIGAVGLGLTAAFGLTVRSAMAFDKEMSAVGSVANATGDQLGQLRTAAIQAGQATAYSATDAATAEEELAKAGISVRDILGGGLRGALDLAAAGQIQLADAATISAQAMNQFHLSGKDVGHIADVLSAGANKSAADVSQLGQSLQQSGLVASQMGLSLEDTVAVLSAFADRGLTASDAGTSLKTMLQKLQAPSTEAAGMMQQLGIRAYDVTGAFVGVSDLAQQLQDSLGGLTQSQRDEALATIFGSDAIRGANVLYTLGANGVRDYRTAVDQVGAAQDTAAAKMNNLSGDVEQLKGSLETLTITSGSGAAGGLRTLTQAATRLVNGLGMIPPSISSAGVEITGLVGVVALGAAGFLKARQKVGEFQAALEGLGPVGKKASAAVGGITSAIGKVGVALAALQVASAALGSDVNPKVADTAAQLEKFAKTGDKTGEVLKHLDYDVTAFGSGFWAKFGHGISGTVEGLTGLGTVFDESRTHALERMAAIDNGLAALASSGHADEARQAFDKITDAAKKQGVSLDDIKRALPQYAAILDGATASAQANITATSKQKQQLDLLHGSLQDAIDATGSLKASFDALNGVAINTTEAQIAMTNAVDAMKQSLEQNGASLDVNTVAGAANVEKYIQGAQAARDYAQAVFDETGSVQQASLAYQDSIGRLDGTTQAVVRNKAQVDALHQAYAQMPAFVPTVISAPGLDATKNKLLSYKQILDDLNGRVVTTYVTQDISTGQTTTHRNTRQYNALGGVYEHAAVGALRDATMYSAVSSGARYAFAEPSTHGEAFIPRTGDLGRSRGIADYVVTNWLGGRVAWPGQGGGGGGGALSLSLSVVGGGGGGALEQAMSEWFMSAVRRNKVVLQVNGQAVKPG